MQIKIQQWGHSLALRIPKTYAADIKLQKGTVVDILETNTKCSLECKCAKCLSVYALSVIGQDKMDSEDKNG